MSEYINKKHPMHLDPKRWAALRLKVWLHYVEVEDTLPYCSYCGSQWKRLELDHIIAVKFCHVYGIDVWDEGNLQFLCRDCHQGKFELERLVQPPKAKRRTPTTIDTSLLGNACLVI